jgi:hypothetical protein
MRTQPCTLILVERVRVRRSSTLLIESTGRKGNVIVKNTVTTALIDPAQTAEHKRFVEQECVPLASIAAQINAEHRACKAAWQAGLNHALQAGRLLCQAKAQLEHGNWLPWVEQHTGVSAREAQRYCSLHVSGLKSSPTEIRHACRI